MKRSPIHPRCIWNLPVLAAVILIALALFLGCSERLWRRWHTLDASLPELSAPLKPGATPAGGFVHSTTFSPWSRARAAMLRS